VKGLINWSSSPSSTLRKKKRILVFGEKKKKLFVYGLLAINDFVLNNCIDVEETKSGRTAIYAYLMLWPLNNKFLTTLSKH
jgi:hypothetical protein